MKRRTVVLYLDVEANVERLTALAIRAASSVPGQGSLRLVGTHATPMIPLYGGLADAVTGGLALRYAEARNAIAERIRRRFTDAAAEAGVEASWDALAGDGLVESAALRELARAADLVVMPQPAEESDSAFVEIATREVVTGAGRPVLVVPRVGEFASIGERLLVGWSPTREATRAVHDALALAAPGARATVLWIAHGRGEHPELERSAHRIADVLAAHGLDADVAHWTNAGIAIGDALLNEAFERGADLLVTGAWGHSRFYDAVIGATTSHLLEHMTLPVLFSH